MNYLIQKAILFVIVYTQAFNAFAYSQENHSDLDKPLITKSNGNSSVNTSRADVGKNEVVKANANQVTKARKKSKDKLDKQSQTILLLKNNQTCGSWFDASGSTGDEAAYEQIKPTGYTKSNAPAAVKKQIAIGVANCDKKYLVEKPINMNETKVTSNVENQPQSDMNDESVNKSKSDKGFFARFIDRFKNSGSQKHICSPGERVMHSDGC